MQKRILVCIFKSDQLYDNTVTRKIISTFSINIVTYLLFRMCKYLSKTWHRLGFSLCKWLQTLNGMRKLCVCVFLWCVGLKGWWHFNLLNLHEKIFVLRLFSFCTLSLFSFLWSDWQLWYIKLGLVFQLPWKLPFPLTATTLVDRISGNSDTHCI